jgi:hypothetical protein
MYGMLSVIENKFYLESYLINCRSLRKIVLLLLFYFFESEIFSILSELQYGQNNIFGASTIISFVRSMFISLKKFLLQLLQCHVILIPSIQYGFVISLSYNNLSVNGSYL